MNDASAAANPTTAAANSCGVCDCSGSFAVLRPLWELLTRLAEGAYRENDRFLQRTADLKLARRYTRLWLVAAPSLEISGVLSSTKSATYGIPITYGTDH